MKLNCVVILYFTLMILTACFNSTSNLNGTSEDAKFLRKKSGVGAVFECSDRERQANCEQRDYYEKIDPNKERDSLRKFISYHGFDTKKPVSANYTNYYDLNLLRDMHCIESIRRNVIACYVTNYQTNAGFHLGDSIATVAMEYDPYDKENMVKFFVYDETGENILLDVTLDSEGPKTVPNVCLNCHGGKYSQDTDSVDGAKFIMFDYELFSDGAEKLSTQEENFKALNNLVAKTNIHDRVRNVISNYNRGNYEAVPEGWLEKPRLYNDLVKPFCRGCHYSFKDEKDISFDTYSNFNKRASVINYVVCNPANPSMPHSERTREVFLRSTGKASLVNFLKEQDISPMVGCL